MAAIVPTHPTLLARLLRMTVKADPEAFLNAPSTSKSSIGPRCRSRASFLNMLLRRALRHRRGVRFSATARSWTRTAASVAQACRQPLHIESTDGAGEPDAHSASTTRPAWRRFHRQPSLQAWEVSATTSPSSRRSRRRSGCSASSATSPASPTLAPPSRRSAATASPDLFQDGLLILPLQASPPRRVDSGVEALISTNTRTPEVTSETSRRGSTPTPMG